MLLWCFSCNILARIFFFFFIFLCVCVSAQPAGRRAAPKSFLSVHTNPAEATNKRRGFSSDGFLQRSAILLMGLVLIGTISYAGKQEGAPGFAAKLLAQAGEL